MITRYAQSKIRAKAPTLEEGDDDEREIEIESDDVIEKQMESVSDVQSSEGSFRENETILMPSPLPLIEVCCLK